VAFSLALVFAFVASCTTAAQAQTDPIFFTTITVSDAQAHSAEVA